MQVISGVGQFARVDPPDWVEQLRVPSLSVGTYSIAAGATDTQSPHTEDEIYICTSGHARLWTPTNDAIMTPGVVAYVPAGEEHRFVDVAEHFAVIVVFSPAYGSVGPRRRA